MAKRRKTRRPKKERLTKTTFLIVCEGKETEPLYFKNFSTELRSKAALDIKGGDICGTSPEQLVEYAVSRKKQRGLDQVWAVFDHDGRPEEELQKALRKAKAEKINIAFSNPCFELWFLIHYRDHTRCETCDNIISTLTNDHLPPYEKSKDVYKELPDNSQELACSRAEELRKKHEGDGNSKCENPSTSVDMLIKSFPPIDKE